MIVILSGATRPGYAIAQRGTPARAKNSARLAGSARNVPSRADVTVFAPYARTPRSVMQECSASSTTPTPGRAKPGGQALGDLFGQPFLDLGPGREVLHQPGQLGQPDDALAGQVADVRDAGER